MRVLHHTHHEQTFAGHVPLFTKRLTTNVPHFSHSHVPTPKHQGHGTQRGRHRNVPFRFFKHQHALQLTVGQRSQRQHSAHSSCHFLLDGLGHGALCTDAGTFTAPQPSTFLGNVSFFQTVRTLKNALDHQALGFQMHHSGLFPFLNPQNHGFFSFVLSFDPNMVVGVFQWIHRQRLVHTTFRKHFDTGMHKIHGRSTGMNQRLQLHLASQQIRVRVQPQLFHVGRVLDAALFALLQPFVVPCHLRRVVFRRHRQFFRGSVFFSGHVRFLQWFKFVPLVDAHVHS